MNASQNPFATGRVERLLGFDPELIGTSWETIDERWHELGRRACVVGHHGSGKTTFLDAMAKRLGGRVDRLFFNDGKRRLSAEDLKVLDGCAGAFLLVDGDEYLGWMERRRLLRASARAKGTLFARHQSRGLPKLLRLKADPKLARVLLGRISEEWLQKFEGALDSRLAQLDGNLRDLWLDCFDSARRADNSLGF